MPYDMLMHRIVVSASERIPAAPPSWEVVGDARDGAAQQCLAGGSA
jgi:hypothetical protein